MNSENMAGEAPLPWLLPYNDFIGIDFLQG
jgi:hypothetical protein